MSTVNIVPLYGRSIKVTPKALAKKRIAKSKLMKIPNNEGKFYNNENENPQLNIKKNTYKIRDREIKDDNLPNPFDIPDHKRIFSQSKGQRKVKPDPFIMSEPHTICDIDDTFYKVIEGRPLRQFTDVKVYMRNIRDITLFKANAAYLKDQMLQFETTHRFEMEQYNQIKILYEKTKMNFVQFAKESYQNAKAVQEIAEVKSLEVAKITDELEFLSFRYVKLRNQLSSIFFSFETLTMYGKFLNSLSPDCWRSEFDYLNVKKNTKPPRPTIESPFLESPEQNDVTATSVASLNEYKTSVAILKEMRPCLYFKKPRQIMSVFDDLSRQCLNYMQIDVFTTKILNTVQNTRDFLITAVKTEVDEMEEFIEIYESKVKFMEQKEMDYKAVFEKLLLTEFQTLYASPEFIKLHTCVQYVNTRVFGDFEDPKDSVTILMQGLEVLYIELTSGLDSLDLEIVKAATNQMFAEDIRVMKRAFTAQRNLKECDILSKALYTSFEPARVRKIVKATAKNPGQEDDKKLL